MKKLLQNKLVFTLLCIICFTVLLGAVVFAVIYIGKCSVSSNRQRPQASATAEPTASPIPDRSYDLGKTIDFDLDLDKLNLGYIDPQDDTYSKEHWLNITTEQVSNATGAVIIKHDKQRCTFLVYHDSYIRLDEGTDGFGVIDMAVCDIDFDDEPDLVFTYSFGVGEDYCSRVGWFDFDAMQRTVSDFYLMGHELALATADDISCELFRAERRAGQSEGGYVLHIIEPNPLATVVEQDGRLMLKLY